MDEKHFDAMEDDDKILVMYHRYRFECDTTLGASKRRWEVLSRWCVGILADARLVDMSLAGCEQELVYCRWLRDTIDAHMEVTEGDLGLQCWFINKPYTNTCPMRGGTHRTRALKFEISQWKAVSIPVPVGRHNLEMLAVSPRNRYCYYVSGLAFWGNCEANHVLCVPSPSTSAYYSSGFGDMAQRFGYLLPETAVTEFTILIYVCFIQAEDYGTASSFWPAGLRALTENGRLRANG